MACFGDLPRRCTCGVPPPGPGHLLQRPSRRGPPVVPMVTPRNISVQPAVSTNRWDGRPSAGNGQLWRAAPLPVPPPRWAMPAPAPAPGRASPFRPPWPPGWIRPQLPYTGLGPRRLVHAMRGVAGPAGSGAGVRGTDAGCCCSPTGSCRGATGSRGPTIPAASVVVR